ncbi:ribosomal protein S8 [Desulfurispirillum indicum S5]|uniref:Small ribosomal subunit protein uS8 n=1 Tax=Desulfurispirillum indicum (strain ATCC BAA-1389 / DSM 22839 / S5) TaxID=653733 RepID=E6W724_DESIS|nr:30S ribosomal protein S8 [Desulfurispirillum indicum]ADU65102.1 ribosomal protein S8 [Desulfurispirillum indicum S5]
MYLTSDPIADMLTRIRNANQEKHDKVDVPLSKLKLHVVKLLKEEGFIRGYNVMKKGKFDVIRISLKYTPSGDRVISGLKRVSRPGRRVYVKSEEIPKVFNGLGIAIVSTSSGVIVDRLARKQKVGGELLAYVW